MSFLHLEIGHATGDGYPIAARMSGRGEVTGRFRLPWSDQELAGLLARLETLAIISSAPALRWVQRPEEEPVRELGGGLFGGLPPGVRDLLRHSVDHAGHPSRVLRVALLAHPPELARLPWEYLYDPPRNDYLFQSHHLIRHVPDGIPGPPPPVQRPVRVLAMVGRMHQQLAAEERDRLDLVIQPLVRAGHAVLRWVDGPSWRQLQREVGSAVEGWHVFHFIGHGDFESATDEGRIQLEDGHGGSYWLPASRLATMLRGHVQHLVVLNACATGTASTRDIYSSIAASLLRKHIPAVVAMQFRITNEAATEFSRCFYDLLTDRWSSGEVDQRSVEDAVTLARQSVRNQLPDSQEWGFPVLLETVNLVRPVRIRTIEAPRDVNDLAFSPDERRLVLACDGRRPWLLDTASWSGSPAKRTLTTSLYAVKFRPDRDGTWFLTAAGDGAVRIWDSRAGTPAGRLPRHPDWVGDIAFSPDAAALATACGDGGVRLWELHRHRPPPVTPRRVLPHEAPVRAIAFDPSGERLATACDDGTVRIWDPGGGQVLHPLPHPAPVFGVAFSPDGNLLATAGADGRVRTWDPDRQPVLDRHCHDGGALSVAFSPDGRLLASAGRDGTAQIRDAATGDLPFTIEHTGPVRRVVFSPSGRWLATASYDNTCQVWQFPNEDE